ncbi:MAG TPA: FG-GAP-like repeat-containing protein [Ignavibacteria bacterium]|nr:FG-GAP-like repeat-containing protein [Ignavibacteria bacterium]HRJ98994.1 FG-GAP-like repeat-containing protein [Ignavibacteria bacterium]
MASQIKLLKFSAVIIFISFISVYNIYSQPFIQQYDGINFSLPSGISSAPFNGGQNNARIQFVDIDGDNDLDLFSYDADTSLYFYLNTGNPQVPQYKLVTTRFQDLRFENWFYFADIDGDGDMDLFTGGPLQSVSYFKNTGTAISPQFILEIEELRSSGDTVIYSEANCVPIFCDIDNDGDLDFFTGQSLGTITFYENTGTANNFIFTFRSDIWQNLLIISPALNNRHGANALEFVDIDNDNDFDLFWGDLFSKGIYFIRNDGTAEEPNVVIADSIYPRNSPYSSLGYNSTRFVDIDNDGDMDMFISVLYLSQNNNNFTFYRNDGSTGNPVFNRITDNFLLNVDVGGSSNPVFADLDNDGDKDLVIGSDYSKLAYYKNTGTVSAPAFTLITDSLPVISESFNYAPCFADLDNDGDQDLLLGSYLRDSLWFFRNTGTPDNFIFTLESRGYQIGLTTLGQSSTPALIDIDGDNDLDLFIGGTNGRLIFYENTGTPENFNFSFVSNFYAGIDAGDDSVPRFYDIDDDGDYDLFIGRLNGQISFYRNDGTPQSPSFVLQTTSFAGVNVHQNAAPFFVDINNDNDADLFTGNIKGGLFFYRNDAVSSVYNVNTELPASFRLLQNYPNPFNPSTIIRFESNINGYIRLSVFDINGKETEVLYKGAVQTGSYEFNFNAADYPSGIYFCRLQSGDNIQNIKMLYLK